MRHYTIEQLKDKALYYISYRIRSKAEVLKKLLSLNAKPEEITLILDELSELGLINDEKLIPSFIRQYIEVKNFPLSKVKSELRRVGFESYLIQDSLEKYLTEEDYSEDTQALVVLRQKYRSLLPEDQKVISFLARKGFNYGIAKKALEVFKNSPHE